MLATPTSIITSDPGILCFHHCNVKVFCFQLPHICPNCKLELDTLGYGYDKSTNATATATATPHDFYRGAAVSVTDARHCDKHINGDSDVGDGGGSGVGGNNIGSHMNVGSKKMFTTTSTTTKLLPFRLPYPFVRAAQYPCAIVLRPTTGDFLNDYNNNTDLHIAVTTSTGNIVEFDRNGLQRHRADNMPEWWQCLLVGDVPEPWYDYWDQILMQICKESDRWSVTHYNEESHNCYTFVLAFLQALAYDKLSAAARSKTSFCEKYIVPRTTTAGKYISLYRKLRDVGIYVHQHHTHAHKQQQKHHHHHYHHNHHHQQQQQQHHYQYQRQHNASKVRSNATSNNTTIAAASAASAAAAATVAATYANNSNATTSSIITRSSTTLCTIEE